MAEIIWIGCAQGFGRVENVIDLGACLDLCVREDRLHIDDFGRLSIVRTTRWPII